MDKNTNMTTFIKKNDLEWDLDNENTLVDECTGNFQNTAWVYVPVSALRHGAQSFGDWPTSSLDGTDIITPWKRYFHVFGRGVQMAFTAGLGSRRELFCEMVMGELPRPDAHPDEREVIGYRWCLMYSKATGLNQAVPDMAGAGSGGLGRPAGSGGLGGGAGAGADSSSDDDSEAEEDEGAHAAADEAASSLSGPKTLNEIFAWILTYNRRQRMASMSPRATVAIAARRELQMIDRGGLGYDSWKAIRSEKQWQRVIRATQRRNLSNADTINQACSNVFHVIRAFANQRACAEQSQNRVFRLRDTGADVPYYVLSHGETWNFRWPDRSRVYRVPADVAMMGVAGLFQHMMMHQQVVKARSLNHLEILLPDLVRKYHEDNARLDQDGDEDMDSDPEDEVAERFSVMGLANIDGGETEILLEQELMNHLSDAPPVITVEKNMLEVTRANADDRNAVEFGSAEGTAQDVKERKHAATAYHGVARSVGRVLDLVGTNYGHQEELTARKMMILARRVALNYYNGIGADTPRVSPKMRIMMEAAESENLRYTPPEVRAWYRFNSADAQSKGVRRMTMLSAYKRKFRRNMETVFSVNHLHHLCEVVEWFSLDAYRHSTELHANFCAISKNGGVGKSNLWFILNKLRLEATMDKLTYSTAAGYTGTENESPNMNDELKCYDEISPTMFAPGPNNANDQESRLKSILSNCDVQVQMTVLMDDGKRRLMNTWVQTIMVMMCSSNIDPALVQDAMRRRFYFASIPEEPTGKFLIDTMADADLDPVEMRSLGGRVRAVFHRKQWLFAEIEKLIHCGALPDVSMDICGVLDKQVYPYFRKQTGFKDPSPSSRTRQSIVARQHCIYRNIMHWLYAPDGDPTTGNKRLRPLPTTVTPEYLVKKLEGGMFVSVEDYCAAMGLLAEEIVKPIDHAVSQALVTLYHRRKQSKEQVYEDLFVRHEQRVTNTAAVNGFQKSMYRDFNYVVFDTETLVRELLVKIPEIMNGFTTNSGAVKRALSNLTDRRFECHPYDAQQFPDPLQPGATLTIVSEDRQKPKQLFAVAAWHDHHNRFAVHTDFVERAQVDDRGEAIYQNETSAVAEALKAALNAKHQIPREIVLGSRSDSPKHTFVLQTEPDEDAPVFRKQRTSVMDEQDFGIMPEVEEMIPGARGIYGQEFQEIEMDLDTWALQQHNKRNYITSKRVSPQFMKVLDSQQMSAAYQQGGGQMEPMFGGQPTRLLIRDTYQEWVRGNLGDIHREFKREASLREADEDFDMADFTMVTPDGRQVTVEEKLPEFFPDPMVFGMQSYDELNFKLIARHPLVEDAFLQMLGC